MQQPFIATGAACQEFLGSSLEKLVGIQKLSMPSMVVHGYELAVKMHGYDGYDVLVGFTLPPPPMLARGKERFKTTNLF